MFELCIMELFDVTGYLFSTVKYNLYNYSYDLPSSSIVVDITLRIALKSSNNGDLNFYINKKQACAIPTDTSKVDNTPAVRTACSCPKLNTCSKRALNNQVFSIGIINYISIFTAGCIAFSEAMNIALSNTKEIYLIFTDALNVLLNLSEPTADIKTDRHILEIKKKYFEFF